MMNAPADSNIQALREVYQTHRTQGRWNDAASLLLQIEPLLATPRERSDLLCELGEIYHRHLSQRMLAIDAYVRALEFDYEKTYLLDRLGSLYAEKQEDFHDIVRHLQTQAEIAATADERHQAWLEMGEIHQAILGQPDQALAAFQRILLENPTHPRAFEAVERQWIEQGQWQALVDLYEGAIDHLRAGAGGDPERLLSLWFKSAGVYKDKLARPLEAMEIYERILQAAPNNLQAREFVHQFLSQVSVWKRIAADYLQKSSAHKNAAQRLDYLKKAAKILFQYLEDQDEGLKVYQQILALDPADTRARTFVESVYRSKNDWSGLVRTYQQIIDGTSDQRLKVQLQFRIGEILAFELRLPAIAVQAFQKTLALDPQHRPALQHLETLYTDQRDWGALVNVLETLAALAERPGEPATERLTLWGKIGRLYAKQIEDPTRAIAAFEKAVTLAPDHLETLFFLEDLYQRKRDRQGLYQVYTRLLSLPLDSARLVTVLKRFSLLLEEDLGDSSRAVELLEKARSLNSKDPQITAALERLWVKSQRWSALSELFQEEAQAAASAQAAAHWYRKLGDLQDRRLSEPVRAREAYQAALDREPQHLPTLRALQQICEKSRQWGAFLDYSLQELSLYEPRAGHAQVPLLMRIAETFDLRQGDFARALPAYERVLSIDENNLTAARALERIYLRQEKWDDLQRIYEHQARLLLAKSTPPDEEAREALVQIYRRMAALYTQKRPDPNRAILTHEKILELIPSDAEALGQLKHLYQNRKRWMELVATLEREIRFTPNPRAQAEICREIAVVFSQHLHDERMALEALRRAVDLAPDEMSITQAYGQALENGERWSDLLDFLQQQELQSQQRNAEPEEIRRLQMRRAHLLWKHLGRSREAVPLYQCLLQDFPDDRRAFDALQAIYREQQDGESLVDLLAAQLHRAGTDRERADWLMAMAESCEQDLGRPDAALEYYRRAFEVYPDHPRALGALTELLKKQGDWAQYLRFSQEAVERSDDAAFKAARLCDMAERWVHVFEHPTKAIECLEQAHAFLPADVRILENLWRHHLDLKRWQPAAEVAQKIVALAPFSRNTLPIRTELAKLYLHHLHDAQRAAAVLQEALALEPDDHTMLELGLVIERERGGWSAFLDLSARLCRHPQTPPARQLSLHRDAARVYQEKLQNLPRAAAEWTALLALDPLDTDALQHLGPLCTSATEWIDLQRRVAQALKPGEKRALPALLVLARVWHEHFRSPHAALECLRSALDLAPEAADILEQILAIQKSQAAWNDAKQTYHDLLHVLRHSTGERRDPAALEKALLDYAQLCEEDLEDLPGAAAAFREVLQFKPGCKAALLGLERLHLSMENWDELAAVYTELLTVAGSNAERNDLAVRWARIAFDKLKDPQQARRVLEERLNEDPDALDVLMTLVSVLHEQRNFVRALEIQEHLVDLLQLDPKAQAVYRSIAQTYFEEIKNLDRAEAACLRALELDPRHLESLRLLQRICEKRQNWEGLLRAYQREASLFLDAEREIFLLKAIASLWAERLGDLDKAAQCLRRVVLLEPESRPLWDEVHHFLRDKKRFQDLRDLLEIRLERVSLSWQERLEALFELGALDMDHLKRPESAVNAFAAVLEIRDDHLEALDRLIALFERLERFEALSERLEQRARAAQDPKDSIVFLERLGVLWRERLNNLANAEDAFSRILTLDPNNKPALEALRDIFHRQQRWDAYVAILGRLLSQTSSPAEALALREELAERCHHALGDMDTAMGHYEKLLQAEPTHAGARAALSELYPRQGRWAEYLEFLTMGFEIATSLDEKRRCAEQAAKTCEERFHDAAKAAQWWEKLADLTGQDSEQSAQALETLRRLYRQTHNSKALEKTLQRSLAITQDRAARAQLLLEISELQGHTHQETNAAIHSLRALLEIMPHHRHGLESLVGYLDREKDREEMQDALQRLLAMEAPAATKGEWHYRLALCYGEKDPKRLEALQKAVAENPQHEEAIALLRHLLSTQKNWPQVAELLAREAEHESRPQARAALYVELGDVRAKHLEQTAAAIEAYQAAHRLDPSLLSAVAALAALHYAEGEFDKAQPLYAQLALRVSSAGPAVAAETYFRLGQIALQRNSTDEAIVCWQQALQFEPAHREASRALGDLFFARKDWAKARKYLAQNLTDAKTDESAALHSRLGLAALQQARDKDLSEKQTSALLKQARDHLQAVLQWDARHSQALEAMVDVEVQAQHWDQALEHLQQLTKSTRDVALKTQALCQKAVILWKHLQRPQDARRVLLEAIKRESEDPQVLRLLAELHEALEEWPEALDRWALLRRLTGEPQASALICLREGRLLAEKIGDQNEALRLYALGLERSPDHLELLEATADIHRRRQHWDRLAEHLRYILKVTPESAGERRATLEMELADVLRQHLGADQDAERLLHDVLKRSAPSPAARLALAQIYADKPERRAQALEEYRRTLEHDTGHYDAYRQALAVSTELRDREHEIIFSGVLRFLGEPNVAVQPPPNDILFQNHTRRLSDDAQVVLWLESEARPADLFGALEALHPHWPRLLWPQTLSAQTALSLEQEIMLRCAAQTLGLETVEILTLPEPKATDTSSSAFVAPVGAAQLGVREAFLRGALTPPLQRACVAWACYFWWSYSYPAMFLTPERFQHLLLQWIRAFEPNFEAGRAETPADREIQKNLKKLLTRALRKTLQDPLTQLMRAWPHLDFAGFVRRLNRNALRFMLLMVQDPDIALRAHWMGLLQGTSPETAQRRFEQTPAAQRARWLRDDAGARDLILFALSPAYIRLREQLGLKS